jgi:hypothetical protein
VAIQVLSKRVSREASREPRRWLFLFAPMPTRKRAARIVATPALCLDIAHLIAART